jgi:hypothetical protein
MIVDLTSEPFRARYRLVGTEIARVAHFDFTGHFLDELSFDTDNVIDWIACYRTVAEEGLPGFGTIHWISKGAAHRWIEFLICPLSNDDSTVTQCISIEDYEPLNPIEFDSVDRAKPRR